MNKFEKKMLDILNEMAPDKSRFEVYTDFLKLTAISLYTTDEMPCIADCQHIEEKYGDSDNDYFIELQENLFQFTYDNRDCPTDILGNLYEDLELTNAKSGQFFTPVQISDLTANMIISAEHLEKRKHFTMCDPCSGAGRLILSGAKAILNSGFDIKRMIVHAIDIDINCVYMSYIQFTLYGIPAIVSWGNSLTDKKLEVNFITEALYEKTKELMHKREFIKNNIFYLLHCFKENKIEGDENK